MRAWRVAAGLVLLGSGIGLLTKVGAGANMNTYTLVGLAVASVAGGWVLLAWRRSPR